MRSSRSCFEEMSEEPICLGTETDVIAGQIRVGNGDKRSEEGSEVDQMVAGWNCTNTGGGRRDVEGVIMALQIGAEWAGPTGVNCAASIFWSSDIPLASANFSVPIDFLLPHKGPHQTPMSWLMSVGADESHKFPTTSPSDSNFGSPERR